MKLHYLSLNFFSFLMLIPNVQAVKVTQTIDSTAVFEEANFEISTKGFHHFTSPNKPAISPKQSVKIYEGIPFSLQFEEKILKRINKGKDGRTYIQETTRWPNLIHGQVNMHYSDGPYGGSGILVGPHHLLTAGHNVYDHDKKEWAKSFSVHLALNNKVAPFGETKVVKVYSFKKWIEEKDSDYDISLLILDRSIGYETGWCGILSLDEESLMKEEVTITGYPGDKGFNQMMTMSHKLRKVEAEKFYYDIDTNGGQSGSGVWINKWGSPYVIGIHTLAEGPLYTGNSGVRLSKNKFSMITEWISETLIFKTPSPNKPLLTSTTTQTPLDTTANSNGPIKNQEEPSKKAISFSSKKKEERLGDIVNNGAFNSLVNKKGSKVKNFQDESRIARPFLKTILDKKTKTSVAQSLGIQPKTLSNFVEEESDSPKILENMKSSLKRKNSEFYKIAKEVSKNNNKNKKRKLNNEE